MDAPVGTCLLRLRALRPARDRVSVYPRLVKTVLLPQSAARAGSLQTRDHRVLCAPLAALSGQVYPSWLWEHARMACALLWHTGNACLVRAARSALPLTEGEASCPHGLSGTAAAAYAVHAGSHALGAAAAVGARGPQCTPGGGLRATGASALPASGAIAATRLRVHDMRVSAQQETLGDAFLKAAVSDLLLQKIHEAPQASSQGRAPERLTILSHRDAVRSAICRPPASR
jgi:hypothetical protein